LLQHEIDEAEHGPARTITQEGIWMKRIRHTVVTILRDIEVAVIRLSGRPRPALARVPSRRPAPRERR
jgi:hypothetical protein